ncbi:MAG: VIT1/CCC1 transporter family protein, partial [Firmicutes bacterium]|nr:VIT1/CCC1 transporter family protein [Bacillota bacterium]
MAVEHGAVNKPRRPLFSFDGSMLREGIFGMNDGLVSTIGLISGEALSHQSHHAVLIAGLSSIGAAMVSMSVGSYVSTLSQNQFIHKMIDDQEEDLDLYPNRE